MAEVEVLGLYSTNICVCSLFVFKDFKEKQYQVGSSRAFRLPTQYLIAQQLRGYRMR